MARATIELVSSIAPTATGAQDSEIAFSKKVWSDDGRFVVYESSANNLDARDQNPGSDIFLRDLQTNSTTLISTTAAGGPSGGNSKNPSITGDGRYVIFESTGPNFSAPASNLSQIYVKDLQTGVLTRVSTNAAGVSAAPATVPSLSNGGRFAVFVSGANALTPGETSNYEDVFVKDLVTGELKLVSGGYGGTGGNADASQPAISPDGRRVAFTSTATNLVAAGAPHGALYVRDLLTGDLTSADINASGQGGGGVYPIWSGDGNSLVFSSTSNTLAAGSINTGPDNDVFLRDFRTGVVSLVSRTAGGTGGDDSSYAPSVSYDGRYVAFLGNSQNLAPGWQSDRRHVFIADRTAGTLTRTIASTSDYASFSATAISPDGGRVLFGSDWSDLVPNDTTDYEDVFLYDKAAQSVSIVSACYDPTARFSGEREVTSASVSADGRFVAFAGGASNIVVPAATPLLYVRDRLTGETERIKPRNGLSVSGTVANPSLNGDGRYVAFESNSSAWDNRELDNKKNVFVFDRVTRNAVRASLTSTGTQAAYESRNPRMSADGRFVVFESEAKLLPEDQTSGLTGSDVYRKDLVTGALAIVSSAADGIARSGESVNASVSADGRYVVFQSTSTTLGDAAPGTKVYRKDLQTGEIVSVSGALGSAFPAYYGSISADGRFVSFATDSSTLVPGDTNNATDVFLKDMATGKISRVSTDSLGRQIGGAARSSLSADAAYVAFVTGVANLADDDTNGAGDVYVKELATGLVFRATRNAAGAQGTAHYETIPQLTADGKQVVFLSESQNLSPYDLFWYRDAYLASDYAEIHSFRVSELRPTATGVEVRFTGPINPAGLNLYDDRTGAAIFGEADVEFKDGAGKVIRGSIAVADDLRSFTFLATSGVLAPGSYSLKVRGGTGGVRSADGVMLDGNWDGIAGGDYVQTFSIADPGPGSAIVGLPNLTRGPGQTVNVPAGTQLGLPVTVTNGAGLTTLAFEVAFDPALLNLAGVTLSPNAPAGSTTRWTNLAPGLVRVEVSFGEALAAGVSTVVNLQADIPWAAQSRYGENTPLDLTVTEFLDRNGLPIPALDRDAMLVNSYSGDLGRNGRYDSFDVQQASRLALRLDSGLQHYPLIDPVVLSDFNDNGRVDSFDVQRLSRLALRLPVAEVPPLPEPPPAPGVGNEAEPLKPDAPPVRPRSDLDGNGVVDAQDVLWAVYFFNQPQPPSANFDLNGDSQFDAADILIAITDAASTIQEANVSATAADDLATLLAVDGMNARKRRN